MVNKILEITTERLISKLNDPKFTIVDIRTPDAYNGWRLNNEKRGGHIKGAKNLPLKWTKYMDWIEIVQSKKINPENSIVLYGNNINEILLVAEKFNNYNYQNIYAYNNFITEWTAKEELPMDSLARYHQLVPAIWVNEQINNQNPSNHENSEFVICHAHYRNRDAYLSGHIPGAIDIDTLALESPETWNRRSPKELEEALLKHGITKDTTVVLYGKYLLPDNSDEFPGSAAGHIGAIRCAIIMMYAGVKDVRVMNGGYQSWMDAGFEISKDDVKKKRAGVFGLNIPAHPEIVVDTPEAKKLLASDKGELVSVRSWNEFIGKVSGYNYIEKKGRIPGAIFGNCGSDAYHMENYRNLDHTTREFHEINEIWKEKGITLDKRTAFYCGTGWRGSEAFFNAWLMGWVDAALYDGGWFEWSNDPNNPYETGIPE